MATEPGRGTAADSIPARLARLYAAGKREWTVVRGHEQLAFEIRYSLLDLQDTITERTSGNIQVHYSVTRLLDRTVTPHVFKDIQVPHLCGLMIWYKDPGPVVDLEGRRADTALACSYHGANDTGVRIRREHVTSDAGLLQAVINLSWEIVARGNAGLIVPDPDDDDDD